MRSKNRKYNHIKSYRDIQTELLQLKYKSRISRKELEIRSLEVKHNLHPIRLIPSLLTQWVTPMMFEMRDQMFDLILKLIGKNTKTKT